MPACMHECVLFYLYLGVDLRSWEPLWGNCMLIKLRVEIPVHAKRLMGNLCLLVSSRFSLRLTTCSKALSVPESL